MLNQLAADLESLEAEINAQLASPTEDLASFLESALNRLRAVPMEIEPKRRINCLINVASTYFHQAQHCALGIEPAALAVMVARNVDDPRLLRKALTVWGALLYSCNNPVEAVNVLLEALSLAENNDEQFGRVAVWTNLGAAFYIAGLYIDSQTCCERARVLATDAQLLSLKAVATSNAALCCLHLQDIDAGLDYIREAVSLFEAPTTPAEILNRVFAESTYIRLLLSYGRLSEASERAALAEGFAIDAKSIMADISVACAQGLVEVYSGEIDVGLARVAGAVAKARSFTPSRREALLALVQANERAGKPDAALRLCRELTFDVRKSQSDAIERDQIDAQAAEFKRGERAVLDSVRKRIGTCLVNDYAR